MEAAEYKRPRVFICESLSLSLLRSTSSLSLALSVDVRVRKSLSGVQQRRLNNSTHVAHIFCCRPPFPLPPFVHRPPSSTVNRGKVRGSRESKIFFYISSKEEMSPFWSPESVSASVPPPAAVFFRVHKSCLGDIILNLAAITH